MCACDIYIDIYKERERTTNIYTRDRECMGIIQNVCSRRGRESRGTKKKKKKRKKNEKEKKKKKKMKKKKKRKKKKEKKKKKKRKKKKEKNNNSVTIFFSKSPMSAFSAISE